MCIPTLDQHFKAKIVHITIDILQYVTNVNFVLNIVFLLYSSSIKIYYEMRLRDLMEPYGSDEALTTSSRLRYEMLN